MNTKHPCNYNTHARVETLAHTFRNIPNEKASARAYLRKVAASAHTGFIQVSNPGSAYENLALQLHAEAVIINCASAIRAFLYQGGSKEEAYELLLSLLPDELLDRWATRRVSSVGGTTCN